MDKTPTIPELRADIIGYAHTDMLFYRAPEEELAALEREYWDPILRWAEAKWNVEYVLTEGMMPVEQPELWEGHLTHEITARSEEEIIELAILTKLTSSPIVALALYYQGVELEAAVKAGFLEEDYQAKQWGEDEEATEKREAKKQECREAAKALDSITNSATSAA